MSNLSAILSGITRLRSGTTSVPVVRPDLAVSITVATSASAQTYGAWVELVAASGLAAHTLIGLFLDPAIGGNETYQVQVGTGGAGAEVAIGELMFAYPSSAGLFHVVPIVPGWQIPANARVAVRAANRIAAAHNVGIKGIFIPRPIA